MDRLAIRIYAGISALLALAVPLTLLYSKAASERASSIYGHNVDSGASLPLFALIYLLPAAGLFAATAAAHHNQWPDRRAVKWLAIAWLTIPGALLLVASLFG
jgi:hypothetical protein